MKGEGKQFIAQIFSDPCSRTVLNSLLNNLLVLGIPVQFRFAALFYKTSDSQAMILNQVSSFCYIGYLGPNLTEKKFAEIEMLHRAK